VAKRTWSVVFSATIEADDFEEAEGVMLDKLIPLSAVNAAQASVYRGTVHDDGGRLARLVNSIGLREVT